MDIYKKTLKRLLEDKVLDLDDKILVVAGGSGDRNSFHNLGFRNVIISNIQAHAGVVDYTPYEWIYQDAEALTVEDSSYDWVFVHAALHHCASPHKALCEMFRASNKGVGVFEARDSLFMKIAIKLKLTVSYELEPAALSNGTAYGYRDTTIPNYVYRWTEREVEKTINSYAPSHEHRFRYFYGLAAPTQRLAMSPNLIKRIMGKLIQVATPVFETLLPKQGNEFSFVVQKNQVLQPWLEKKGDDIMPNMDYLKRRFNIEKYVN